MRVDRMAPTDRLIKPPAPLRRESWLLGSLTATGTKQFKQRLWVSGVCGVIAVILYYTVPWSPTLHIVIPQNAARSVHIEGFPVHRHAWKCPNGRHVVNHPSVNNTQTLPSCESDTPSEDQQ